jgi:hypothetical protein
MKQLADFFSALADSFEGLLAGGSFVHHIADFFRQLADLVDPIAPTGSPGNPSDLPDLSDINGVASSAPNTLFASNWLIDDLPAGGGDHGFVPAFQQIANTFDDLIGLLHQQGSGAPTFGLGADGFPSGGALNGPADDTSDDFIALAAPSDQADAPAAKTPFPLTPGLEDFHGVLM